MTCSLVFCPFPSCLLFFVRNSPALKSRSRSLHLVGQGRRRRPIRFPRRRPLYQNTTWCGGNTETSRPPNGGGGGGRVAWINQPPKSTNSCCLRITELARRVAGSHGRFLGGEGGRAVFAMIHLAAWRMKLHAADVAMKDRAGRRFP